MKQIHGSDILKVILFVLLFFVLLFGFSCLLRPTVTLYENNERLGLLGYYAEPEDTIDVLYLGGSDATVFWMPFDAYQKAGFTSYTYGKSMLRAPMFEDLLDEALRTQSPSLLVVSLRTLIQSGETVEEAALRSVTDALPYTSLNRWQMIYRNRNRIVLTENAAENGGTGEPVKGFFSVIPFYFDIMKYHDNWQDIWKDSWNYRLLGSFGSDSKGFLLRTDTVRQERKSDVAGISEKAALSHTAEEAIRSLCRKAAQTKTGLLFVMPPYCESPEDRMRFNRAAEIITEERYAAMDLNEVYDQIGLDEETDYYNEGHVNTAGAQKYTDYFTRYLTEHYDLPDHRGDPVYEHWEAGIKTWRRMEREALRECREGSGSNLEKADDTESK